MNNQARQKLCEIVTRFGHSVTREPRRCEGLLRDYAGAYRREIAVLIGAIKERVTVDLLAANPGTPREVLLNRLAQRLHDNLAMDERAAQWAVNSWALALRLTSNTELEAIEQTRSKQEQPEQPAKPTPVATTASVAPQRKEVQAVAVAQTSSEIIVSADGNGDYVTISEALAAASPDSRLLVRQGLYSEGIIITKPIEIIGDGDTKDIIIESTNACCLLMRTEAASVRGLTLRQKSGVSNTGVGFFAVDIPYGQLTLEDCDITSNSLSCVGIHNDLTNPTIRRCKIHASSDSGIYIFNAAAGTIEECDIYDNSNVCVAITERAKPVIKRCLIHDGRNAGIVAWNGGAGLIEECDIFGNAKAGIGISEEGNLIIRRCLIYGGENSGVFVHNNGQGVIENCDIYGHVEAEVAVTLGGDATLRECQIHNGKFSGLFLRDEGRALLDQCKVYAHADAGMIIQARGIAVVRDCRINRNGRAGLSVGEGGVVSITNSDLTDNLLGAWDVEDGAFIEKSGNAL